MHKNSASFITVMLHINAMEGSGHNIRLIEFFIFIGPQGLGLSKLRLCNNRGVDDDISLGIMIYYQLYLALHHAYARIT